jgi:hypothetical protein
LRTADWQVTRREILYVDREDGELVAIDKANRAEKWYWPMAWPPVGRFIFANDGQPAIYAESYAEFGGLEPTVVVLRPGKAPPWTRVHVRGRILYKGRAVGGVAVRAREAVTRSTPRGTFEFDVRTRGYFRIFAREIPARPCGLRGFAQRKPGDATPVEISLETRCTHAGGDWRAP